VSVHHPATVARRDGAALERSDGGGLRQWSQIASTSAAFRSGLGVGRSKVRPSAPVEDRPPLRAGAEASPWLSVTVSVTVLAPLEV